MVSRLSGIAAVAMLLSGCASIQMGDPARSAAIKKFERRSDVGQIYVCRDDRTFGMGVRPDILLDGKTIATVARSTYAYAEVLPGNHTVLAKSLEHDSKIAFDIAAGQQIFFQTWISLGVFVGWALIEQIDVAKGKDCVNTAELVEVNKL